MKKISLFILALLLVSACFHDDRDNFMVPDSLGLSSLENFTEASVHSGTYLLGIDKSGKGFTAAKVHINTSQDAYKSVLDAFNTEHGTSYRAIDPALIAMDRTTFDFAEKDVVREVNITWDALELANYIGNKEDYVIPVIIESDTPEVKVHTDRSFLLIHLNRSGVTVNQKLLTRVVEKKDVEPDKSGVQPPLQENVVLDVVIDKPMKGIGVTYPVVVDKSLIAKFNAEHETDYVEAPAGLVTLDTAESAIPEGGKSGTIKLTIDYSVLLVDGKLPQFPSYLVPVRLDVEAAKATLNGHEFQLKGMTYDNLVTYIAFDWKETKKGFQVNREWGRYSSEGASWSDFISGFTAGADRNVTLDGDNVYIAETNATKNLWALSLKDPATYSKLPVGTVIENGTFYVSCPRVVPNDNPDINGGKPVLMVSSMHTGGDPVLYVYDNGIDADPKMITLTTWASRRLGDTFTWWGSLQDGVLMFKDFNSTQGTVTFWLRGKLGTTFYLVGRVPAPPVTGAGAYFPFPESTESGFASTRGGTQSWLVNTKDLNKLEGADNNPVLTELAPDWADCGFRYFELAGKRYIAVAKQDNAGAGRLIIMEGELTAPWPEILSGGKLVYTAAIQNETENEGLDTTPSPMSSGNSGMDLDIFQKDTDVYIAVIKQNVGLSLFRVSNDGEE